MIVANFMRQLYENGRVCVSAVPVDGDLEISELTSALHDAYAIERQNLAGKPPKFASRAAVWAANILYQSCQFLVHRELSEVAVRDAFQRACPETPSPEACLSVDLSFRYLPDLHALARGVSREDPLVEGLRTLAHSWPLSSVGVKGMDAVDISAFIEHPCTRQLYVDRILERDDTSRLCDPRVLQAVRESVGIYVNQFPKGIQAEMKV